VQESKSKRLSWSRSAATAYERTIAHIAAEDEFTARKVVERVAGSLALIESNPGIGTLLLNGKARRLPVARTGHSLNYIVGSDGIVIVRWYRQRQNVKR
jgi:plasmid stabilization system protein ParE